MTKKELKKRGAKDWTKQASDELANFLELRPGLPIVAHGMKYDRDKVLKPAFKRVENQERFPEWSRWKNTQDLMYKLPDRYTFSLDEALDLCGLEPRDEDAMHDAVADAKHAGLFYMKLIKMPEPYKSKLGFWYEGDGDNGEASNREGN